MSCEALFPFESLIAMVELEGFLQSMLHHVPMQFTRSRVNVVALVAFERLFFCMLPHNMNFQLHSLNARKLTRFLLSV